MIVLDTHALLWLVVAPARLSGPAGKAIDEDHDRVISTVTGQEIAYLERRGRLTFDRPVARWLHAAMAAHDIVAVAPTLPTAIRAGALDPATFPGDPADRLIYATAIELGADLVSADERLRGLDARVVW